MRTLASAGALLALTLIALAFAACGGDGDDGATPTNGSPTPDAAATAPDSGTPGDATPEGTPEDGAPPDDPGGPTSTAEPPGNATVPASAEDAVAAARRELLDMFEGRSEDEISVVSITATDWPDACLGRPDQGEACAQVVTPGYQVVLRLEITGDFTYHTDRGENVRLADFDLNPAD